MHIKHREQVKNLSKTKHRTKKDVYLKVKLHIFCVLFLLYDIEIIFDIYLLSIIFEGQIDTHNVLKSSLLTSSNIFVWILGAKIH